MRVPFQVTTSFNDATANFEAVQQALDGNSTTILGYVLSSGTPNPVGTNTGNWSVTRTGTGVYAMVYSTSFALAPVVLITPSQAGAVLTPSLTGDSGAGFTVSWRNSAGALTDANFGFAALSV